MALIDTSSIAYQLKAVYGDQIVDLFNRQTMTYNMFMKSGRKATYAPGGTGFVFATRQSDIESVGARAQNAYLPEPLDAAGVQFTITPKLMYASLRLSGLAMEAGKGGAQSFVDVQGDAIANVYKALITDLNRQCWGDGYGLLGTLSAVATPATGSTWTATFSNDRGVRYIRRGMVVDFYTSGGALDVTNVASRVKSINPTTKVVTFEALASTYETYHPLGTGYTQATGTIPAASQMVRMGARVVSHSTSAASYEICGLNGLFDDGTLLASFQGQTLLTAAPEFVANIIDNSAVNRELSIDLMLQAMDLTSTRSDQTVEMILAGLGQRRKYFALLANDVRYAPGQFVGGYETLQFAQNGQVTMKFDPHARPNRMYFMPADGVKKYELTPIGWGGMDGQKMHWRDNYDQATMFLRTYSNLGVEKRNALTLLDDLTEPAVNVW
jgi:hypothetical protein